MRKLSLLIHFVKQDLQFLHRQGVLWLYLGITVIYAALIIFLPRNWDPYSIILLLFSDPAVMGFLFSAAILFIEMDQGILGLLQISGTSPVYYLLGRGISMGLLAQVVATILCLVNPGLKVNLLYLWLAMGLSAMLFSLLGMAVALGFRQFTDFLILGTMVEVPLILPVLRSLNLWDHWIMDWIPSQGILGLLHRSTGLPSSTSLVHELLLLVVPSLLLIPLLLKGLQRKAREAGV